MKSILLIIFTQYLLFSSQINGIDYLKKDSMNMLDWGIYKINEHFKDRPAFPKEYKNKILSTNAKTITTYDSLDKQIKIKTVCYIKSSNQSESKALCEAIVKNIRDRFRTSLNDDLIRRNFGIFKHFRHEGTELPTNYKDIMKDIEESTKIEVEVWGSQKNNDKPPYKNLNICKAPLMGSKMFSR